MNKVASIALFFLGVFALSACNSPKSEVPAGWRVLKEPKGLCQFAVPPEFISVTPAHGVEAVLKEGSFSKITAGLLATEWTGSQDWNSYKDGMKYVFRPSRIIEDTQSLLYYPSVVGSRTQFIAVKLERESLCNVSITLSNSDIEKYAPTVKQIVDSIGTAK